MFVGEVQNLLLVVLSNGDVFQPSVVRLEVRLDPVRVNNRLVER